MCDEVVSEVVVFVNENKELGTGDFHRAENCL
jgi:hypothetical protein